MWTDYELLDSGQGAKLERFGNILLSREESLASHPRTLDDEIWQQAQASYTEQSGWTLREKIPDSWIIGFENFKLELRLSPRNRHIGIFPEQSGQWKWLLNQPCQGTNPPRLLNLFGHTGAASLAAGLAGYAVTHVDASKPAIHQGKENQRLSGLEDLPIRWIHEDAVTWVDREIKRGSNYHAIMLDPPTFGRGPKGELWKNDKDLPGLLKKLLKILSSDSTHFLLLNHYTTTKPTFPKTERMHRVVSGLHTLKPANGPELIPARWYRMDFQQS